MRFLPIYFCLAFLSSCYQTESTVTDTLLYCTDKAPNSFNPQISHDIASLDASTNQLYNRLVKIDPISKKFVSDIATDWDLNKDQTIYTFHLRADINFHQTDYFTPTRKLNADDVIYSFNRMLSKQHPFHFVNVDAETYGYNHPFSNLVAKIRKIDEHTIQFILNKPDATLLPTLAAHYAVIHSKEYATTLIKTDNLDQIDFLPIGTGPYQLKASSTKKLIRYEAHKSPWEKPAHIKKLIFDITPNSSKRYAKLLSGECDIITNPAPSQVSRISHQNNVLLSSHPTANTALIAFNTSKPILHNIRIRHALSTAIDLQTIVDAVFFDNATLAINLLPKNSWAFNPRTPAHVYLPKHSQQQLQNNNFDFSQTLRILAPIKNSIFNPNYSKSAELIQSNLAEIGIKSEIVQLRRAELQAALTVGDYDLFLTGISPYISDPDSLFRPLLSCNSTPVEGNTSQWCDKKAQSILDDTILETHFINRIKNYYQLQHYIQQQKVYLPVAHIIRFDAFNKNISGIQLNTLTGIDFHGVNKRLPFNMEVGL